MAKIVVSTCDGKHEITPMCLYRENEVTSPFDDTAIADSEVSEETN